MEHRDYWRNIADLQQSAYSKRVRQQQLSKQHVKRLYMAELQDQLRLKQMEKKQMRTDILQEEKKLLYQTIEQEAIKKHQDCHRVKLLQERQKMAQLATLDLRQQKSMQQRRLMQEERAAQLRSHRAGIIASQIQNQSQIRNKDKLREQLVRAIEENRERKRISGMFQRQRERSLLEEGERRKLDQEVQRTKFYHALRERAKQVDYGSHGQVWDNHQLDSQRRKREREQNDLEGALLQQRITEQQRYKDHIRKRHQEDYGRSLRRQIEEKSASLQLRAKQDLQNEQFQRIKQEEAYRMWEKSNRQKQLKEKEQIDQVLKGQMILAARKREQQGKMTIAELSLNSALLSSKNNDQKSIDQFELDYQRKKQFAIIKSSFRDRNFQKP